MFISFLNRKIYNRYVTLNPLKRKSLGLIFLLILVFNFSFSSLGLEATTILAILASTRQKSNLDRAGSKGKAGPTQRTTSKAANLVQTTCNCLRIIFNLSDRKQSRANSSSVFMLYTGSHHFSSLFSLFLMQKYLEIVSLLLNMIIFFRQRDFARAVLLPKCFLEVPLNPVQHHLSQSSTCLPFHQCTCYHLS